MLRSGFNILAAFILFSCTFCKSERKPTPTFDFNIDSFVTSIKTDKTLNAHDVKFDKSDSILIVYVVTDIPNNDSGALRAHFKSLHVTNAIRRAKNISGLVFVKTPSADSLQFATYQYHVLASFFKAGTRFAER